MAFPPPTLPTNRTNATAQQDSHPQDHNAANLAINDTVARLQALITEVGSGPKTAGGFVSVPAGFPGGEYTINTGVPGTALGGSGHGMLNAAVWRWDRGDIPPKLYPVGALYVVPSGATSVEIHFTAAASTDYSWSLVYQALA